MNSRVSLLLLAVLTLSLGACELVGGIFKAGFIVGLVVVIVVVGLIFKLFSGRGG
jgi:hypothetical protein